MFRPNLPTPEPGADNYVTTNNISNVSQAAHLVTQYVSWQSIQYYSPDNGKLLIFS